MSLLLFLLEVQGGFPTECRLHKEKGVPVDAIEHGCRAGGEVGVVVSVEGSFSYLRKELARFFSWNPRSAFTPSEWKSVSSSWSDELIMKKIRPSLAC
jgi:hypothetical protein